MGQNNKSVELEITADPFHTDLQPTLGHQTHTNLDALLTSLLNLTNLSQVESRQKSMEPSGCFNYRTRDEGRARQKRELMETVHAYVEQIQAWYSEQVSDIELDFVQGRKPQSKYYAKCIAEQGFILFGRLERLFDMAVEREAELNKAQFTKGLLPGRSGVTAENLKACAQNLKGFWSQFSNNMLSDKRLNGRAFGPFNPNDLDDRKSFNSYCEQEKNWNSRLERFPIDLNHKPQSPEFKHAALLVVPSVPPAEDQSPPPLYDSTAAGDPGAGVSSRRHSLKG